MHQSYEEIANGQTCLSRLTVHAREKCEEVCIHTLCKASHQSSLSEHLWHYWCDGFGSTQSPRKRLAVQIFLHTTCLLKVNKCLCCNLCVSSGLIFPRLILWKHCAYYFCYLGISLAACAVAKRLCRVLLHRPLTQTRDLFFVLFWKINRMICCSCGVWLPVCSVLKLDDLMHHAPAEVEALRVWTATAAPEYIRNAAMVDQRRTEHGSGGI